MIFHWTGMIKEVDCLFFGRSELSTGIHLSEIGDLFQCLTITDCVDGFIGKRLISQK